MCTDCNANPNQQGAIKNWHKITVRKSFKGAIPLALCVCVCAAESRQRQREVSYIIHAILRVFSDHCDRDMTESLRDLGNTQLFTYTLHINTLSLIAGRKQLESSHVTLL